MLEPNGQLKNNNALPPVLHWALCSAVAGAPLAAAGSVAYDAFGQVRLDLALQRTLALAQQVVAHLAGRHARAALCRPCNGMRSHRHGQPSVSTL